MTATTLAEELAAAQARYRESLARRAKEGELARQARDDAVRAAIVDGISQADVMRATGLSRQRISQIARIAAQ